MDFVEGKKRKRVSKKNKTSWRKHIDIEDVNDFLETSRQDERIGNVSDKPDHELFFVDTTPKKQRLTARGRRKINAAKPSRSLLALENLSKVPDPIVKRNRVRTKDERKHFIAKSIAAANAAKGIIPKRKLQSENDRLKSYDKLNERVKSKKANKTINQDIWSVGDVIEQHPEYNSQWIDKNVAEHNLCNTGTAIKTIPKGAFHKRSKLKSVSIPHPGTSYNPSRKDHEELLKTVIELEEKFIREEEHLNRVTTSMFDKMTAAQRDELRRKEMSAGIEELEGNVPDFKIDDSSDSDTYKAVNPAVIVKRKDKKKVRKAREQKVIQQKLLKAKLEKKKVTDIHRIRHLKEEIKEMEESLKDARKLKAKRKQEEKFEPRRLGKVVFQEQDIDFSMPEAICGNLRNVKSEGSLLKDRFKSLQQRNILAPSVDVGLRRRREVKRFVRKSHKEEEPQPNALKKSQRGNNNDKKIRIIDK
ncbi:Ribosome biogenesis protein NOP53 [Pseudolycoriella hygida]|uniref:Ribosome biogenesis protein NOP53 n=1 Tax=Pseudolycoriella hygida TaxID=35572 RepID=A0A9Q0S020_9DIPT|nr:Ribosome biogenesis protein NOP53 [Pseudolycoriella hygida]